MIKFFMDLKVGSAIRAGFSNWLLFYARLKVLLFEFLSACNGFVRMQRIKSGNALLAINVPPIFDCSTHTTLSYEARNSKDLSLRSK